ncbi:MAG TPA: hypothetical protein VMN76_04145 [Acidobacteriota bacterium]|nr:hypothetical protein [Acidobacteriota bacterium]
MSKLRLIWILTFSMGICAYPLAESESTNREVILPLILSGPGGGGEDFQTTLNVLNGSGASVEATLEAFSDSGEEITADFFCSGTGDRFHGFGKLAIPAEGSVRFASRVTDRLVSGWVRISWNGSAGVQASVEVSGVRNSSRECSESIGHRSSSDILSSPIFPGQPLGASFRSSFSQTDFRRTAFSFVNPDASRPVAVRVAVFDSDGRQVAACKGEIEVPANGRVGRFLHELVSVEEGGLCTNCPPCVALPSHGSVQIEADGLVSVGAVIVLLPDVKLMHSPVEVVR